MTIEAVILNTIRKTYKNDDAPKQQLYSKILKALFRYETDQKPVQYASQAALAQAKKMNINLKEMNWNNQTKVDPGRKIFHYEHCNPINTLIDAVLKGDMDVTNILNNNIVCWILKSENKKLDEAHCKSKRDGGWEKCYRECGIEPVKIN